jgi:thiamine-monophosphate kinase
MFSESEIVRRFFTPPNSSAVLGVGDDSALIRPATGMELAVSADMLVSGKHFFPDTDPCKLGFKALAVNLSDMAAMGAKPRWATLALALPEPLVRTNEKWLEEFANGFFGLASTQQVELIGGDITCGPLTICVQIIGEVEKGKALRRSGAKPGDDIWISGRLGDAALALSHKQQHIKLEPGEIATCLPALHTPIARVELGRRLVGLAHSSIDISDGLLADLGHILECSKVAAVIKMNEICCSAVLEKYLPQSQAINCLLAGGDDYELCFTAQKAKRGRIEALSHEMEILLTRIGRIDVGEGLVVLDATGNLITPETTGYDHFHSP